MDRRFKVLIEKALRRSGVASAVRVAHRHSVVILAYHNIVPDGEPIAGDRSLHLKQHDFARQLDWLRRHYEVVPLTAIHTAKRPLAKPRAVITFDDAYRGAVTAGASELAKRGIPATIFVAPAFIGGRTFWWDSLSRGGAESLPSAVREHCLELLAGRNDRVMDWAVHNDMPIQPVPDHQAAATEDELATCGRSGLITFASHTWSHPNLRRIDESELLNELEKPLAWLHARFRPVVDWLAYPYGLASRAAATTARRVGYQGALLVSGGGATSRALTNHPFAIPRLNIPAGLSLDGFAIRVSGLRRNELATDARELMNPPAL